MLDTIKDFLATNQFGQAFVFGFVFILLFLSYMNYRKKHMDRRFAMQELNAIRDRYAQNLNNERFIYEINLLIRRIAVKNFSRQQVEGLTGQEWLEFLDATGETHEFSQGAGKVLAHGNYNNEANQLDTGSVYKITKKWIRIQT